MIQYPLVFNTSLTATAGTQTTWKSTSPDQEIVCAIPKEFEGPGGAMSPEDIFAQALLNCFTATFQVIAEKSRITFSKLAVTGKLTVDRDDSKRPVMKAFHFDIRLEGVSNEERAAGIVKKAIETGFILNSVKTELTYDLTLGK